MNANTITGMSRRRRRARRRLAALALGVCALAIPASAAARPIDNAQNSPFAVHADGSTSALPSATIEAPPSEPAVVSGPPAGAADGFDWGDAALGAGATIALVTLSGTVLFTVRRRPGVSPSVSTG